MSGYTQKQDHDTYSYQTQSRPDLTPGYGGYAPVESSFDTHHQHQYIPSTQVADPQVLPHVTHLPYMSPSYTTRDPPHTLSDSTVRGRPFIELTSNGPYRGFTGETLRITFRSSHEFLPGKHFFTFDFGRDNRLQATLSLSSSRNSQSSHFHYNLTARIPQFSSDTRAMPLMIDVQDENCVLMDQKNAGYFYFGTAEYQSYQTDAGKRKLSAKSSEMMAPSAKRSASHSLHPLTFKDSQSVYSAHQIPIQNTSSYSTPLFAVPSADRTTPERSPYLHSPQQESSARSSYGAYGFSPSLIVQSNRIRSPTISYASHREISHGHSPRSTSQVISAAPSSRGLTAVAPTWVRTTELRQQQSTPRAANYGTEARFNPFAQYPDTKAALELVGNLSSMCENWTALERAAKRRLVEFQRSQSGSTITASFSAVMPDDHNPERPVVSCIWWARRKEYFVTSVDAIALLEGLVAVRFTVEEKNRIRRNLEGFKPYTVAKNKDESDDFFRLIMGFGAPKPRNIEKDIKIFPWSILAHALNKIIGKYSASYASTSSSIGPSVASASYRPSRPEEFEQQVSPTSTTSSHARGGYGSSMTSTARSTITAGASTGIDVTTSSHDLRTSSSLPHLYGQGSGSHWAAPPGHPQYPSYGTGLPHSAPSRSWNLEDYINQQQQLGTSTTRGMHTSSSHGYYGRAAQRSESTAPQYQSGPYEKRHLS